MDIGASIRRLLVALDRLDALSRRSLGLTGSEQLVISFVAEGVLQPGDLARAVGMTTAGMTNLVDRLEKEGYLRRERHPDDRRRIQLILTKRGLLAHLQLHSVHDELAALAATLGQDTSEHVQRFLDAAVDLVEARLANEDERA